MTTTATPTAQHVSENVAALLFRARMSQRDLARATGIAPKTINGKMLGESDWKTSDLDIIGNALYVSAAELVGTLPDREEWEQRRSASSTTRW